MPITYGKYTKQLKLLPLILHDGGGATVQVRYGFVEEGQAQFVPTSSYSIEASPEEVSAILDAPPTPGLSRRDDLSLAVYTWLVTVGHIPAGEVS